VAPERPPTSRGTTIVFTALAGVVAAALLFALAVRLTGSSGTRGNLDAPEFDVGPARQRAAAIDRDGPLLFQDPLGRGRDIYVQHLQQPEWAAFEARAPGAPSRCVLRWDRAARAFVDPCDGRTFPADGAGLTSYPVRVDGDGHVLVDLRSPVTGSTGPAATPAP
jgi:hypothetical protein